MNGDRARIRQAMRGGLFAFVLLAAGCRTVYVVPVAGGTPAVCGNIRLYGTDNVPFAYEELGTIALLYQHSSMDQCLSDFVEEARKLHADAVLNFMLEPDSNTSGSVLVRTSHSTIRVRGTAVKIKRP